jgi:membrane protease YdiL (CAAX protease family)
MKYLNRLPTLLICSVLLFLIFPQTAYAYLDPGTGSYFFQLIIGALVGASFAIKIYWKKINTFFAKLFSRRAKDEQDNN